MRPHHLRVQAFGPFADVVELDLDALSEAGLFLLHGETGAGKTSLLDAVVWALYGEVPGARATAGAAALGPRGAVAAHRGGPGGHAGGPAVAGHAVARARAAQAAGCRHHHRPRGRAARGAPRRGLDRAVHPGGGGRRGALRPAGHERCPVLLRRAAAAGRVRPVPARTVRGARGAARPALRDRAVRGGGDVAGPPAQGVGRRGGPGDGAARPARGPGGPGRRRGGAGPGRGSRGCRRCGSG